MEQSHLLDPVQIGKWNLPTRIVMAPMTRSFADDKTGVVGLDVVEYYRKRAADGIGLIITEGINPIPRAKGTFGVPGIYTEDQIKAWKKVTDAVHQEGGTIVAQLWHVGRLTHHELTGGFPPQAPSRIKAEGLVHRLHKPYEMPEEMSQPDIQEVIEQHAQAARNAMVAGFDGVEIHGAHGYLIDQFNSDVTNKRKDQYGGNQAQRLTFMKELLSAVIKEVGVESTIIRFSELKDDLPEYKWSEPEDVIKTFIVAFREVGLKILHPSTNHFAEIIANGMTLHQLVRKYWDGVIIGVGNLDVNLASQAIARGTINLAAFGRPLLANPDFVQRIRQNNPLTPYDAKQHLGALV
ncbi:alkene reductase [Hazenella coriacea]|uniref:N-ethylmaleimide reductase n=1 Tax=Hazenella coriacea TaxID=1179467 RepID=A0A4R3L0Y9_9BACL|nr:alkene reductase [Hazenella coriacea]TCS93223.1 N-ethylmaleimide reductase [Hazenella coriacea]